MIATALLGLLAVAACGVDEAPPGSRTLAVQPRVVVDGMVELAAVAESATDASLMVDEVLFHAPNVHVQDGKVRNELLTSDDPLLFRYEAASSDGFGDVVGGERQWRIHDEHVDGDLIVGFAPLSSTDLLRETGVDLDALAGHTATVHGYMLMSVPDAAGLGDDACEGDPDGNPAACNPTASDDGEENDGDPDGNPSEGDPDGNPAEGDPDGNPAKGTSDEAEGDPDGNPADGDPDGNPSEGPEVEGQRQGEIVRREAGAGVAPALSASDQRVPRQRVPFLLVLNSAFSLRVPVAGLFEDALADDEVRPLELHVRLDELLSGEVLAFLAKKASDEQRGQIVVEIPDAQVGLDVNNQGVERRVRTDVDTDGIRVVDRH